MKYIEVTKKEAIDILKKSKGDKVMIAIQDMGHDDVGMFCPHLKSECENMIYEAETIASMSDDFIKQLDLFSEKQLDLMNIKSIGYRKIILLKC